jgi:hypothetical protein
MRRRRPSPGLPAILWMLICCGASRPAPGAEPPSADALKRRGVEMTFSSRVAGHDEAMWREEFAAAVAGAFPPRG